MRYREQPKEWREVLMWSLIPDTPPGHLQEKYRLLFIDDEKVENFDDANVYRLALLSKDRRERFVCSISSANRIFLTQRRNLNVVVQAGDDRLSEYASSFLTKEELKWVLHQLRDYLPYLIYEITPVKFPPTHSKLITPRTWRGVKKRNVKFWKKLQEITCKE